MRERPTPPDAPALDARRSIPHRTASGPVTNEGGNYASDFGCPCDPADPSGSGLHGYDYDRDRLPGVRHSGFGLLPDDSRRPDSATHPKEGRRDLLPPRQEAEGPGGDETGFLGHAATRSGSGSNGFTIRRFVLTTDAGSRSSPAAWRALFTHRSRFQSWSRTGAYGSKGTA